MHSHIFTIFFPLSFSRFDWMRSNCLLQAKLLIQNKSITFGFWCANNGNIVRLHHRHDYIAVGKKFIIFPYFCGSYFIISWVRIAAVEIFNDWMDYFVICADSECVRLLFIWKPSFILWKERGREAINYLRNHEHLFWYNVSSEHCSLWCFESNHNFSLFFFIA